MESLSSAARSPILQPAQSATTTAAQIPAPTDRDLRLDFFRGLSLWFIFLDHVPSNLVAWFTVRNFGFSDASEIFVFISGYTATFVYGRVMRERGFVIGAARILKRAWQIYVAFVFLLVFYLAEIAYVASRFENPLYTEEFGIFEFFQKPDIILIEALKLRFLPANVDVLPLYIVLMLIFPGVLWFLLRVPNVTLAASIAFYALARWMDWNLALYPYDHTWFFNPFAWQLLFVIGGWCALGGVQKIWKFLHSHAVTAICIVYLVIAALYQLSWLSPGVTRRLPDFMLILPLDKTGLSLFRLTHFLAMAILVVRFVPSNASFLRSKWARPLVLCGEHSLEIFCLGIFLSFSAHFILTEVSSRLVMQIIVSLAGIGIMIAVSALMTWYKDVERRGGKAPPPANEQSLGGQTV
jgi:hypothetical protein